jgi:delta-aminolevulinic acid dehydratase/porphobilinogen synthase
MWTGGYKAMMESLIVFKRAGADEVLTYFAAGDVRTLYRFGFGAGA